MHEQISAAELNGAARSWRQKQRVRGRAKKVDQVNRR